MMEMRIRFALVIVALSAVASLTGCKDGASQPATQTRPTITPVDGTRAHALVAEGATLLDVRTEREFVGRHPEKAVNIPVGVLESRIGEISKDKPVVVYCESGGRSAMAAQLLASQGYEVYDLASVHAWDEGNP
jgi:rhodanese-related sulfurtransferase